MNEVTTQELLLNILLSLASLLVIFIGWKFHKDMQWRQVVEAMMMAVAQIKNEYVDECKRLATNGKLTPSQQVLARNFAIARGMEILGPKAAQLFKAWGEAKIRGLIEIAVNKWKRPEDVK